MFVLAWSVLYKWAKGGNVTESEWKAWVDSLPVTELKIECLLTRMKLVLLMGVPPDEAAARVFHTVEKHLRPIRDTDLQ